MIRALYSAGSGMNAQQMTIDSIAHNLANANTAGFKARRMQFQDLLYQNFLQPGAAAGSQTVVPSGLQIGLGTRPAANSIILTQGSFQQTDNPLDVVIEGKGFFQIRRPTGEIAYTRSGNFQMDRDGNIVTGNGDPLEPQITIPAQAQSVTIAAEQLILRKGLCPPPGVTQLDSIELAAGRKPVRAIQTGAPIYAPMLAVPHEVERGDRINVEVSRGAVVLAFEAIAESTGRAGESIIVRNPANGRRFQARVQEKGKVSVKK